MCTENVWTTWASTDAHVTTVILAGIVTLTLMSASRALAQTTSVKIRSTLIRVSATTASQALTVPPKSTNVFPILVFLVNVRMHSIHTGVAVLMAIQTQTVPQISMNAVPTRVNMAIASITSTHTVATAATVIPTAYVPRMLMNAALTHAPVVSVSML